MSGCSIHPIPYDVPGYNTIDIVKKIRCETAKAIDQHIVYGMAGQEEEQRKYASAVIVYHFTFTITENNKADASADFKLPLTSGTFSFGIGGGTEKERAGERDFTVTDTFAEVLEEIYEIGEQKMPDGKKKKVLLRKRKDCTQEAKRENWIYPIAGRIGIEETIRTFVGLHKLHLLDTKGSQYDFPDAAAQAPVRPPPQTAPRSFPGQYSYFAKKAPGKAAPTKAKKAKEEGNAEEFSDEILFTTTISGNLSPKVELKPTGSGLRLTGADATLSGKREDKHKLILTLTLPKKEDGSPEGTKERAKDVSDKKVRRSLDKDLAQALRRL
jgi:hypothetical protein